MELHFVVTANVFGSCPYWKKAKSAPAHYVRGSVAHPGDGISTVRLNCPQHFDAITLERLIRACWAKVEWACGRILVRDRANAGWIDYMLKDRQKSVFDGFFDCVIVGSLHNPIVGA